MLSRTRTFPRGRSYCKKIEPADNDPKNTPTSGHNYMAMARDTMGKTIANVPDISQAKSMITNSSIVGATNVTETIREAVKNVPINGDTITHVKDTIVDKSISGANHISGAVKSTVEYAANSDTSKIMSNIAQISNVIVSILSAIDQKIKGHPDNPVNSPKIVYPPEKYTIVDKTIIGINQLLRGIWKDINEKRKIHGDKTVFTALGFGTALLYMMGFDTSVSFCLILLIIYWFKYIVAIGMVGTLGYFGWKYHKSD